MFKRSSWRTGFLRLLSVAVVIGLGCVGLLQADSARAGDGRAVSVRRITASGHEVVTWGAAPQRLRVTYEDRTVRMVVRASVAGTYPRIRLSNVFGVRAVRFGSVYLGRHRSGASVVVGSNRRMTFSGSSSVVVPPGASVLSDPQATSVAALDRLVVSVHIRGASGPVTGHAVSSRTSYVSGAGDHAWEPSGRSFDAKLPHWPWLEAVIVTVPPATSTVVCLGDSITDGTRSTRDTDRRYPDRLAERILAQPASRHRGVANVGISSNRVTGDGTGVSAMARFERDVLAQPGVRTVIFSQGINDIRLGIVTTPQQLIAAYRQVIAKSHANGIRVIGGTLLPFAGDRYFTRDGELLRQRLNSWIRTSEEFDSVVDFDKALRDPATPSRLRVPFDSGDHLHPNDLGYRAMAMAVDLTTLG